MPCILFSNQRLKTSRIAAATPHITMNTIKKSKRFAISKPKNEVVLAASPFSPPPGINADKVPANLFAAAFAKNQVPINKEENLIGESLDTIDNPIGDKQSSPIV